MSRNKSFYFRERIGAIYSAYKTKGLFTWSGGPRSSGVGFFSFHALGDTKQKKPTPLDRQRAKKVVSDSPGLVDFAIGLVNSVFNLPDGQVMFYEEFE